MGHKILFVMKSPGWPWVHTLSGQGCGDAGIATPGSGSWGHNPLGAILGKPRSPEGCLSSGDAVRTVGPMGCYGQRRAGGPRLRVGTDLSVCEPSPLELSCPALH